MSVKKIEEKDFKEVINNKEKKVLVDCYADWCGPCRMLSPIIDELASEIDSCEFYKLNVDDAEEVSREYGIMSIPTVLIFKDGKEVAKSIGLKTKEELKEIIEK
ncbi:MAG: thioredoxin [Bacilli bacterium]|nr:thioredoxin [Bacilli bacterium]